MCENDLNAALMFIRVAGGQAGRGMDCGGCAVGPAAAGGAAAAPAAWAAGSAAPSADAPSFNRLRLLSPQIGPNRAATSRSACMQGRGGLARGSGGQYCCRTRDIRGSVHRFPHQSYSGRLQTAHPPPFPWFCGGESCRKPVQICIQSLAGSPGAGCCFFPSLEPERRAKKDPRSREPLVGVHGLAEGALAYMSLPARAFALPHLLQAAPHLSAGGSRLGIRQAPRSHIAAPPPYCCGDTLLYGRQLCSNAAVS
jgi:hypothetical protein